MIFLVRTFFLNPVTSLPHIPHSSYIFPLFLDSVDGKVQKNISIATFNNHVNKACSNRKRVIATHTRESEPVVNLRRSTAKYDKKGGKVFRTIVIDTIITTLVNWIVNIDVTASTISTIAPGNKNYATSTKLCSFNVTIAIIINGECFLSFSAKLPTKPSTQLLETFHEEDKMKSYLPSEHQGEHFPTHNFAMPSVALPHQYFTSNDSQYDHQYNGQHHMHERQYYSWFYQGITYNADYMHQHQQSNYYAPQNYFTDTHNRKDKNEISEYTIL